MFLICYSIVDPLSLEHAQNKWLKEVKDHADDAPIILIGTKSDMAAASTEEEVSIVTREEADKVATEMACEAHIQTSALKLENVSFAFDKAIKVALEHKMGGTEEKKKRRGWCSVL